jgi:hypothetical protein
VIFYTVDNQESVVIDGAYNVVARFYGLNRASDAALFIRALPAVAEFGALAYGCECRIQTHGTVYTLTAWREGKRYEAECSAPDLLFALRELCPRVRRLVEAGPVPMPAAAVEVQP